MRDHDSQADGAEPNRAPNNPGPSTNREPVPDGLEGSLTRNSENDQADGITAVSPKSAKPGAARESDATTSKQHGDREEGRDRSLHNL